MSTGRTDRQREIERAMRAHPAGRGVHRPGAGVRDAGADASPVRAPVRLTARGRRLVAVLGLSAAVGAAALVGSALGGPSVGALHLAGQSSVVVRPGDTLWSIASSVAGGRDVREVVDGIQERNGLPDSTLVPGQVLRLP